MAEFITWSDDWLLGVDALDNQHKALADCINTLAVECKQAQNASPESMEKRKELLARLLDELYTTTKKHFSFEESLMRDKDYPAYTEHAREHVMLCAELKATFVNGLKHGRCNLNANNLNALRSWLIAHVSHSDRDFANFLLKNNR
jgi:hemerythrin-like metal-binding protein